MPKFQTVNKQACLVDRRHQYQDAEIRASAERVAILAAYDQGARATQARTDGQGRCPFR